jgi:hypothetical protein
MKKNLLFVGAMLAFWGLALGALHPAMGQMMGTATTSERLFPVHVVEVNEGTVTIEPMLPVQFVGSIEGLVKKGEVLRCKSKGVPLEKLDNGKIVNAIQLDCEGEHKIILDAVSFQ